MSELIRANQDVFMINDSAFMVDEDGNIYRAVPPVFREAFLDEPSSGPRPTLSPKTSHTSLLVGPLIIGDALAQYLITVVAGP